MFLEKLAKSRRASGKAPALALLAFALSALALTAAPASAETNSKTGTECVPWNGQKEGYWNGEMLCAGSPPGGSGSVVYEVKGTLPCMVCNLPSPRPLLHGLTNNGPQFILGGTLGFLASALLGDGDESDESRPWDEWEEWEKARKKLEREGEMTCAVWFVSLWTQGEQLEDLRQELKQAGGPSSPEAVTRRELLRGQVRPLEQSLQVLRNSPVSTHCRKVLDRGLLRTIKVPGPGRKG